MQMINEITVMQQNKNLFNKILAGLKRQKKEDESYYKVNKSRKKIGRLEIKLENCTVHGIDVVAEAVYDNIIMIRENNLVYFCVTLKETHNIIFNASYNFKIGDPALDWIRHYKRYMDKSWMLDDEVGKAFSAEGITVDSDNSYITGTSLYKELNEVVNEINDTKTDFYLSKQVPNLTKLSQRENILPLVVCNVKDGFLMHPYQVPSSTTSKVMTKLTFEDMIRYHDNIDYICERAYRNASVKAWCVLKIKKDSKFEIVG